MALVEEKSPFDDGYVQQDPQDKDMSCSLHVLAILSTCLTFIGSLVILMMEKRNHYIRLVASQSAICHSILFVILFISALLMFIKNWFFYTLFICLVVLDLILTIFLAVLAYFRVETCEAYMLPGLSKLVKLLESMF